MADVLGSSGFDIDIRTGKPRFVAEPLQKANKAQDKVKKLRHDAWAITAELHENKQLLRIWMEKYRDRLLELAADDAVCMGLEAPILALRDNIEFKLQIAEKVARRVMGPHLEKLVE